MFGILISQAVDIVHIRCHSRHCSNKNCPLWICTENGNERNEELTIFLQYQMRKRGGLESGGCGRGGESLKERRLKGRGNEGEAQLDVSAHYDQIEFLASLTKRLLSKTNAKISLWRLGFIGFRKRDKGSLQF